ncbi:MAG: NfeD family protein [Angelakisella sp.]
MGDIIGFLAQNGDILFWLAVMVVLLIVEACTTQMLCIWFALGAFVTVVAALLGADEGIQFAVFVVVSALSMIFTRKFVVNALKVKKTATNADSFVGLCGSVLEEIDNAAETGRVRVNGLDWMARTSDNSVLHIGDTVVVQAITGAKVIVIKKADSHTL